MTSPLPPPPPVAAQLTEKVVLVVPPDGTVTVRGFAPLTLQFDATPASARVWSPEGPVPVPLALVPIGWLHAPPLVIAHPPAPPSPPALLVLPAPLPL